MPTLTLTNRFSADSQAVWRAAVRRGWDVHRVSGWRIPDHLRSVPEPVVYAEAIVAPLIAEQLGIQLEDPPLDWMATLPREYAKREIHLSALGDERANEELRFIKLPNDKSFPARPYRGSELPEDSPDDTPVILSEIVEWEKEFRCFLLDRSLLTYSIYLRNGELQNETGFSASRDENAQLEEFVNSIIVDSRVTLMDATALDVGLISDRGWAIVEQNSAWGAGLYGCDPDAVLSVLYRASGH